MKKTVQLFAIFTLAFAFLIPFHSIGASAKCQETNIGETCTNPVYKVQKVKAYYTKSDVKKIVKRYDTMGSNKAQIISYAVGLASNKTGLAILMYNIGANNEIKYFKKAKSKGTGLQISYTVTTYYSSSQPRISNVKYTYK